MFPQKPACLSIMFLCCTRNFASLTIHPLLLLPFFRDSNIFVKHSFCVDFHCLLCVQYLTITLFNLKCLVSCRDVIIFCLLCCICTFWWFLRHFSFPFMLPNILTPYTLLNSPCDCFFMVSQHLSLKILIRNLDSCKSLNKNHLMDTFPSKPHILKPEWSFGFVCCQSLHVVGQ